MNTITEVAFFNYTQTPARKEILSPEKIAFGTDSAIVEYNGIYIPLIKLQYQENIADIILTKYRDWNNVKYAPEDCVRYEMISPCTSWEKAYEAIERYREEQKYAF